MSHAPPYFKSPVMLPDVRQPLPTIVYQGAPPPPITEAEIAELRDIRRCSICERITDRYGAMTCDVCNPDTE